MELLVESIKFIVFSLLIVGIAKYILVTVLRKLAEALALKPKTVGNIAGIATSVPELLTVSFSAFSGLLDASIYNILSSNVINILQYTMAVMLNKNTNLIKNKAIRIDIGLVLITVIIPIILLMLKIEAEVYLVPVFIVLFLFFYYINHNAHKLYYKGHTSSLEQEIKEEEKWISGKKTIIVTYTIYLLLIGIALYVVGNLLGNSLEKLAAIFHIPQYILGVALGFVTSLPELITFFETQKHHKSKDNELEGMVEATNNLLTSNILNLFIIQSIGILIYSIVGG